MNEHRSPITPSIVVRPAGAADRDALRRLALLDAAAPLGEDVVLAEQGGGITAAIDLADCRVIADPFAPSAGDAALLRAHVCGAARRARRRTSLHLRRLAA